MHENAEQNRIIGEARAERAERWDHVRANDKQGIALDKLARENGGVAIATWRDTALPHIAVRTEDGKRWRVWPSGVTELMPEATTVESVEGDEMSTTERREYAEGWGAGYHRIVVPVGTPTTAAWRQGYGHGACKRTD